MKKLVGFLMTAMIVWLAVPNMAAADCGLCGDLTGDGEVNVADLVAFTDWYFNWPDYITPACPCAADVNCSGGITVGPGGDLEYLVNYMFYGGPPPCDPNDDGIPDCDWCN